jgi:hypothetical protein
VNFAGDRREDARQRLEDGERSERAKDVFRFATIEFFRD